MEPKLNNIKWYLIGAVLGLLAGAVLYFVQPVKWKGQALIRIGQIVDQGDVVEPVGIVMERFRTHSFVRAVAERVKRNEIEDMLNVEEDNSMTVRSIKNTNAIDVAVISSQEELVRAAIDGVVAEIISKHDVYFAVFLADTTKELARVDSEIEILSERLLNMDGRPLKENATMATLVNLQALHVLDIQVTRSTALKDALSSRHNKRTTVIEGPFVSEYRILSSVWRTGLLGALSGLCLSAIWIRWKSRVS